MATKEKSSTKGTLKIVPTKEITSKKIDFYSEDKIGQNAGQVWTLLDKKGIQSVKLVTVQLGISEQEIYLAIGWLAREGKVLFEEKNNEIYLFLK